MKKTLLLLPAAALLLTGCGEAKKEETNTQPTISQISDAAVASLANMYKSAVNGVSLELTVSGANFHYVNTYTGSSYSQKTDVEIKNAGFKLKLDVRNLTKSIKDWEAAIVVEDLQATETVIMNNTSVLSKDKTFSDIDFGVYLKNGNLYANLSDTELKSTALEVMDIVFGPGTEKATQYKAMVEQYSKNLYLENAIDTLANLIMPGDISNGSGQYGPPEPEPITARLLKESQSISDLVVIPAEIPTEILLDLKEELPMLLTQIMGPASPLKNAFNISLKDNYLNKIEVNFKSTDLPAETFEGDDVNFVASLTANFGASGLLSSVSASETFDVTIVDDFGDYPQIVSGSGTVPQSTSEIETTHVTGSISESLSVSYPTAAISMPDFSGYEPFVFPEF